MIRRPVVLVAALLTTVALAAPAGATTSPGAPQGNVTPATSPTTGVGVVAQAAPVEGRVALLLQNNSSAPARIHRVTAVATRADGSQAARGRTTAAYPQVLAPGDLSLAAANFPEDTRADAVIEVKVRSTPVSSDRVARALSVGDLALSPPLTGKVAQTIQAVVTNGTTTWTARKPRVAVMCFGESSLPTTFTKVRAGTRRLRPGASTPVTVPLTSLCPTYLVAARAT